MFNYKEEYTNEISFPLGGIGSGSVGLSGNGRLVDWEICNRPNKGSYNEYSNFAIKAEDKSSVLDARILEGDVYSGLMGDKSKSSHHSWGYGHGVNRTTLAGFAHFKDVTFDGRFPVAKLTYKDKAFPGIVELTAFNPFIPSDSKNSSIPAAFFEWSVENNSLKEITYTIAFSCGNMQIPETENHYFENGYKGILLDSKKNKSGAMCIATDCKNTNYQEYWYRSGWFDDVTTFWREFSSFGDLKNRCYSSHEKVYGRLDIGDMCTLASKITLKPGEKANIRFVLSWYYPKYIKYWDGAEDKPSWNNFYSKLFDSVTDVAKYSLDNFSDLLYKTLTFRNELYGSSMPEADIKAVGYNLAVLKSTTCLRLDDGTFYAFEGVNSNSGSCEGSCTHVWNYAYALPFLFPDLERSMRDADYKYNLCNDGKMCFRTMLPLGCEKWDFHACVDGQYGGIIKLYRDWKISGDDNFLKRNWSAAKKAIAYAWSTDNPDRWDREKSGVITGRQHHTLDVELFGANAWLTGFYVAGLIAGAEMAQYLGEIDTASEYRKMAALGKQYIDKNLWNGQFYVQNIDVKDKSLLFDYESLDKDIYNEYWNKENDEIKYQIGDGCIIDMMVAQWHCDICSLGDIFDRNKVKTALSSLYDINFKSMRDVFNPCRIFAVNDEKGLLICNWRDDTYKPKIPIPYSEEVMTGFEYAAAALMISRGLEDKGESVVAAVSDRYDGKKRNPFAQIECGSSYARSMAGYSLLLIRSGFVFDLPHKTIGFNPINPFLGYRTFWSLDGAWGTFKIVKDYCIFDVLYGDIFIQKFILPNCCNKILGVKNNEEIIDYIANDNILKFAKPVKLTADSRLIITINFRGI